MNKPAILYYASIPEDQTFHFEVEVLEWLNKLSQDPVFSLDSQSGADLFQLGTRLIKEADSIQVVFDFSLQDELKGAMPLLNALRKRSSSVELLVIGNSPTLLKKLKVPTREFPSSRELIAWLQNRMSN
jgi:hypothetical protein